MLVTGRSHLPVRRQCCSAQGTRHAPLQHAGSNLMPKSPDMDIKARAADVDLPPRQDAVSRRHATLGALAALGQPMALGATLGPALGALAQPATAAESNKMPEPQPQEPSSEDALPPGMGLPSVPMVTLRQGSKKKTAVPPIRVSQIMKGCWQLDGFHKGDPRTDRTSGRPALTDFDRFADAGITTLDTADVWGPSEAIIGQWLRLYPWNRDSTQIITHITITEEDMPRLSSHLLKYRLSSSLARLGVPSTDLVLLQWETGLDQRGGAQGRAGLRDAALWLADLQGAGLTKGVGTANLDVPHLLQVLDADVPVAATQVQYSVLDRRPALYLQDLCLERGVPMLAYGALAGGWLSKRWLGKPANKAALDTVSKAKYGAQLKEAGGWSWLQEVLLSLSRVAKKHQVPVSSVALRWVLEQPGVKAVSVGARNPLHVRSLQSVVGFSLDEEDLLELDAAYEGSTNLPTTDVYTWERGGPWS